MENIVFQRSHWHFTCIKTAAGVEVRQEGLGMSRTQTFPSKAEILNYGLAHALSIAEVVAMQKLLTIGE